VFTVTPELQERAAALADALGGAGNIIRVEPAAHTRLRVQVRDARNIDEGALEAAGVGGVMRVSDTVVHVIVGESAAATATAITDELQVPAGAD